MSTIDYCPGSVMSISTYGSLCLVEADGQNEMSYTLPSLSEWMGWYWYIIFFFVVFIALCVATIVVTVMQWCKRSKSRMERALLDKRVDGMYIVVKDVVQNGILGKDTTSPQVATYNDSASFSNTFSPSSTGKQEAARFSSKRYETASRPSSDKDDTDERSSVFNLRR